jgi:hypothetical protein
LASEGDVCYSQAELGHILRKGVWRQMSRDMLRRTILEGVPYHLRRELWIQLADVSALKLSSAQSYSDLHSSPVEKWLSKIDKDIDRTFSQLLFFQDGGNREKLRRVLVAYSNYDPEIGYCQGLNFIAGGLLQLNDFSNNERELDFELLQDPS